MMHPVGPHAAQTYWIRRALVAIVAVALVVGVVWWALGRASGPGSGPDSLAATTSDTTAPKLTGVLATNLSTDSPLESTTESEMQFEEPDLSAADVSDAAESDSTTGADAAAASATAKGETQAGTGADGAKTTAAGTEAASTTAAGPSVAVKTTKAASPSTAPTGPRVVETTVPAPVTVTVTKLVPATATAAKTTASKPTTTAPPKPSYDSAGRLICPAASISLTGVVWGTVAGQQPRLGMNVTNVGKQACRQDVSGAKQVYTVYSAGGDRVWSTADCFPGEGTEVRTLGVGQKASFVIVWSGTTSEPGCTAPREKVKAGKYTLVVQLGPLKSKPLAFTMH
jgi:hypothetical protein